MKILHLPTEIAGQNSLSVQGLQLSGMHAKSIFQKHPFYSQKPDWEYLGKLHNARLALQLMHQFDVYHYHYGQTLFPWQLGYLDAAINKLGKKKVIVEFWGSDIRMPSVEIKRNKYYENSYSESDFKSRLRTKLWSQITQGHAIFADHSLDYALSSNFQHIHIVPQRFDVVSVTPKYQMNSIPKLVHIPSQMAFKGTEFIRKAVKNLQARSVAFEYIELSGVSHQEAMNACASADIVVDQVRGGSHGIFAVEAMAMGKPVVCYILPELVSTYPEGFPIINANPDTLESVLENWLSDPQARFERGEQSREYAERIHDIRVVAKRLIEVYEQLP
jgi:hypothetical protein